MGLLGREGGEGRPRMHHERPPAAQRPAQPETQGAQDWPGEGQGGEERDGEGRGEISLLPYPLPLREEGPGDD